MLKQHPVECKVEDGSHPVRQEEHADPALLIGIQEQSHTLGQHFYHQACQTVYKVHLELAFRSTESHLQSLAEGSGVQAVRAQQ